MNGHCRYCNSTRGDNAIENCFRSNIPLYIENQARIAWGLTNATSEQFFETFLNKTKGDYCVTPDFIYTDKNESECLKYGSCRNSPSLVSPITTEQECPTNPNYNGECEICTTDGYCQIFFYFYFKFLF